MAATYDDHTGNGSNKNFTYTYPVLKTEDVKVSVDGVTQTSGYTVNTSNTRVEFTTAPANGAKVRVYRLTTVGKDSGDEDPKAVFAAGSSIRAKDLNANQEQALFGIHELQEKEFQAEDLSDGAITSAKIFDGTITNTDINASAAIAGTKVSPDFGAQNIVTTGTINSVTSTELSILDGATLSTNDLNQLQGKTVSTSLTANSTTEIPTSSAVNSKIIQLLDALGGFYAISNEVSFPNTNPDPEDDAGTVVSISDAGGVVVNSSGVSTTGRTLGGSTVTITGFPSAMQSKTLAAGMGLIVQTTSTLNTYTYHKAIGTDADIISVSDTVDSFNERYRFGSSDPTSNNDQGDLFFNTSTNTFKVYDDGAWIKTVPTDTQLSNIEVVAGNVTYTDDLGLITQNVSQGTSGSVNTVAGSITNVNTVSGSISNVNTVAGSIADVNRYANEYKIAASAPSSPSEGDLWYDSTNNKLKYHDGSNFQEAAGSALLDEDNMSSNSATQAPTQQSVKAYVDSLAWLDQSTKEDGSVIYWKNSASKYYADNAQNIKTLEGGNF